MMEFKCPRCAYSTSIKQNFIKHINRKMTCQMTISEDSLHDEMISTNTKPIRDIICENCLKSFKHQQSLSRHKKTCKSVIPIQNNLLLQILQAIQSIQSTQSTTIPLIPGPATNIIQHNQHNQITQNITINLVSFGQENIKHIEAMKEYLTDCFMSKDMVGIIEKTHFDNEYPQHQNIRLKSLKHGMMETYVNGKWIVTDKDETLDRLVDRGANILKFHVKRNKKDVIDECEEQEEDFEKLKEWIDFVQDDTELKQPVLKKLQLLFINDPTTVLANNDFE